MTVKDEFIIQRGGKDFVLYPGLLAEATEQGLKSIVVYEVQLPTAENGNQAIMKATVMMEDDDGNERGPFIEYGDADPSNVNSNIAPHIIRMAATRAKARALRDATNIGITAFEEIVDPEGSAPTQEYTPPEISEEDIEEMRREMESVPEGEDGGEEETQEEAAYFQSLNQTMNIIQRSSFSLKQILDKFNVKSLTELKTEDLRTVYALCQDDLKQKRERGGK